MALTDYYCVFNRLRGTSLVSPEDLRQACRQFGKLGFAFGLATIGAVTVVQMQGGLDTNSLNVTALLQQHAYLTAGILARSHRVSAIVAAAWLAEEEARGQVARDESIEGLRYYPNRFLSG